MSGQRQSGNKVGLGYKPRVFRLALLVILAPSLISCACILTLEKTWLADVQSTKELKREIDYNIVAAWAEQDLIAYKAKALASAAWGDKGSEQVASWERRKVLDAVRTLSTIGEKGTRLDARRKRDCQFLLAGLQDPDAPTQATPLEDGHNLAELFSRAAWLTRFGRHSILMCTQVLHRFDEDAKRLKELADQESTLKHDAQAIVWVGIVSTILAALGLVISYSGWMSRRLSVLLNNARVLGKGTAMKPLPGQDELVYLNRALQQVDEKLLLAARQRRSVLEMVAHDVRSPIGGADISLAIIEKQHTESKTRSVKTNAAIARVNLRATVKFVEELLKTEKEAIDIEDKAQAQKFERVQRGLIFRSGLLKQLLVLLLVPLMIQIGCLSFLYEQITVTQSLGQAQQRQVEMLATSSQIIITSVRLLLGATLAALEKDESLRDFYQSDYHNVLALLQRAISDAPLEPEKQFWREFRQQGAYLMDLAGVLQNSNLTTADLVFRTMSGKMTRLTQLIDTDRLIQDLEHDYLSMRLRDLQEHMEGIQNSILAALTINLGIAFLLVVIFSSNVNRRLKILLANVRSLEETAIYEPTGGDDEIYQLDEALRTAKQEVHRAEERRHLILSRIKDNISAPLTVAITAIEDIDEDVKEALSDSTRENLDSSLQSIYRVRQLVDDFLSGADSCLAVKQQDTRLLDILAQSVKGVQSLAEQKKINLVDSSADVVVNADTERMIQVFTNLLSNAIKFSPEGASVQISSSESDGRVIVSVIDEGPGMDPSDTNKIFDKHFQTEHGKSAPGFGLGLSIARQIVEAHGGVIAVESKKGAGSTFSVSLPKC